MLGLLSLLLVITYLDRVCISVAGPRMQDALHIGPLAWGWVTGVFTLSYAAFEIPSGALGDRIGARRGLEPRAAWQAAPAIRTRSAGHGRSGNIPRSPTESTTGRATIQLERHALCSISVRTR